MKKFLKYILWDKQHDFMLLFMMAFCGLDVVLNFKPATFVVAVATLGIWGFATIFAKKIIDARKNKTDTVKIKRFKP